MNFSGLGIIDYIYFITLIFFLVFFGIRGATRSIIYSLKIGLTVWIPFYSHKKILKFSIEKLNIEKFSGLYDKNPIFFEFIAFTVIFLVTYVFLSLLIRALDIKSPSQLEFKILDMLTGAMIGIVLFSVLFYFLHAAFLKNIINEKNRIMEFNISIYENLDRANVTDEKKIIEDSSSKEKKNDKNELY